MLLTALFNSGIAFHLCVVPLPELSTFRICHLNAGVEHLTVPVTKELFAVTFLASSYELFTVKL